MLSQKGLKVRIALYLLKASFPGPPKLHLEERESPFLGLIQVLRPKKAYLGIAHLEAQ